MKEGRKNEQNKQTNKNGKEHGGDRSYSERVRTKWGPNLET